MDEIFHYMMLSQTLGGLISLIIYFRNTLSVWCLAHHCVIEIALTN